jgi:hypothetical protein
LSCGSNRGGKIGHPKRESRKKIKKILLNRRWDLSSPENNCPKSRLSFAKNSKLSTCKWVVRKNPKIKENRNKNKRKNYLRTRSNSRLVIQNRPKNPCSRKRSRALL